MESPDALSITVSIAQIRNLPARRAQDPSPRLIERGEKIGAAHAEQNVG